MPKSSGSRPSGNPATPGKRLPKRPPPSTQSISYLFQTAAKRPKVITYPMISYMSVCS